MNINCIVGINSDVRFLFMSWSIHRKWFLLLHWKHKSCTCGRNGTIFRYWARWINLHFKLKISECWRSIQTQKVSKISDDDINPVFFFKHNLEFANLIKLLDALNWPLKNLKTHFDKMSSHLSNIIRSLYNIQSSHRILKTQVYT